MSEQPKSWMSEQTCDLKQLLLCRHMFEWWTPCGREWSVARLRWTSCESSVLAMGGGDFSYSTSMLTVAMPSLDHSEVSMFDDHTNESFHGFSVRQWCCAQDVFWSPERQFEFVDRVMLSSAFDVAQVHVLPDRNSSQTGKHSFRVDKNNDPGIAAILPLFGATDAADTDGHHIAVRRQT